MDSQLMDGPHRVVPPCSNLSADAAHCKSADVPSDPGLTGRMGEFLAYATLTGSANGMFYFLREYSGH